MQETMAAETAIPVADRLDGFNVEAKRGITGHTMCRKSKEHDQQKVYSPGSRESLDRPVHNDRDSWKMTKVALTKKKMRGGEAEAMPKQRRRREG